MQHQITIFYWDSAILAIYSRRCECPLGQFQTLPGLLRIQAALPHTHPNACVPNREAFYTILMAFAKFRPGRIPATYRIRGWNADHLKSSQHVRCVLSMTRPHDMYSDEAIECYTICHMCRHTPIPIITLAGFKQNFPTKLQDFLCLFSLFSKDIYSFFHDLNEMKANTFRWFTYEDWIIKILTWRIFSISMAFPDFIYFSMIFDDLI